MFSQRVSIRKLTLSLCLHSVRAIVLENDVLSMTAPRRPLYSPVGGIVYIEILEMPGRPMMKGDWKIREGILNVIIAGLQWWEKLTV